MEIDRVQPMQGLKIERTGSEQERRRREQTEERFEDLLESTLAGEGESGPPQQREGEAEPPAGDTVSLTGAQPPAPLVNDLVSISTAARVTAEVHNASRPDGDPQSIERELSRLKLPPPPAAEPAEAEEDSPPPKGARTTGPRVDTLA